MANSTEERLYTVQGVQENIRADGRGREDFRAPHLTIGVIEQASGSARLQLGATDVLVAVKAELGEPSESSPDAGRVSIQVDVSSCASPDFKGRGSEEWSSELEAILSRSISEGPPGEGALDFSALCVVPGRQCWVLHVDGLVLNYDGGVVDALSLAMRAALADTKIPSVKVVQESPDAEPNVEVSDEELLSLDISNFPVSLSVVQLGRFYAIDCTKAEEDCAGATLHVSVNAKGNLVGSSKSGPEALEPGAVLEMLEAACRLGLEAIHEQDARIVAIENAMEEDEGND